MRLFLFSLLIIHGLIHLLGFSKAFQLADVSQLTQDISKPAGAFWLVTALLFIGAFACLLLRLESWWIVSAAAIALSQFLIVLSWTDAKFGTIMNVIILVPVIISFLNSLPTSYLNRYKAEVLTRVGVRHETSLLTEMDMRHVPAPVQKYLRYAGAVGKPKVFNFRAVNHGSMRRTLESSWTDVSVRQHNFYDDPARLFYIESTLFGIAFDGLHAYIGNSATMQIKVASAIQVVDARGEKMNQGETVTMFNDMCILAPAALIDTTIQWEEIDSLTVKAFFTNQGYTIAAMLSFNEAGALVNFISNDRFLSGDGKTYLSYPWSTPVRNYKDFDGRKVASYGEAIWHTPGGEFSYAKFDLVDIEYNCRDLR
ncbi:MAG: hypothetical protein NTU47_13655 [Ignavibacteriales bacterium]|nr:hypothetical protein [Ignavibacteriales bacterium]